MTLNLKVPKILSIISAVLLLLGFLFGLLIFSQVDSPTFKDMLVDIYSDPTFEADLESESLTPEEFTDSFIDIIKDFFGIGLVISFILVLLNVIGIFIMNKSPLAAAILFIITGILSLISIVIPALLITAGAMILVKRSKQMNQSIQA